MHWFIRVWNERNLRLTVACAVEIENSIHKKILYQATIIKLQKVLPCSSSNLEGRQPNKL